MQFSQYDFLSIRVDNLPIFYNVSFVSRAIVIPQKNKDILLIVTK